MKNTTGVLLINIGSPQSPHVTAVKRYLREFLSDPHMITLPALWRWLLVNIIIVPFRAKKSTHAYQQIWQADGPPLIIYSQQLCQALQHQLGNNYQVAIGMRYGQPAMLKQLEALTKNCKKIIILPLFPQYAFATTGSVIAKLGQWLQKKWHMPAIEWHRDFFSEQVFIDTYAALIREKLTTVSVDLLLFSYHGLPEHHLNKQDCNKQYCSRQQPCPSMPHNYSCYRRQCFETTHRIAELLQLSASQYMTSFQSRLGKIPWITPYTNEVLPQLIAQGIKNIAVVCPSFVTDCLETLEEIGIRARQQWQALGGHHFVLIPCLNADGRWVQALKKIIQSNVGNPQ